VKSQWSVPGTFTPRNPVEPEIFACDNQNYLRASAFYLNRADQSLALCVFPITERIADAPYTQNQNYPVRIITESFSKPVQNIDVADWVQSSICKSKFSEQ